MADLKMDFTIGFNHQSKLNELLRNLTSVESKLCLDASKEFIKILKSDAGDEFILSYLQISPTLVEIWQAWEIRKGQPAFSGVLKLISAILKHCVGDGGGGGGDGVNACRSLDKFSRVVVEEKMGDLYKELNSKEGKRQESVFLLLASVVRRSAELAWEVAKVFDFKLAVAAQRGEGKSRKWNLKVVEGSSRRSGSTRKAFVGFAMAFLEGGNPRLLRGVLQKKELYSGVLRGIGKDDEETVVYVLSILRDKVLVPESSVSPGLRSTLFGSGTLEQLVGISATGDFVDAAELAYSVLIMVCTDPVNGLMPDLERQPSPLRGNVKRLSDLMKKLKPTEFKYHKDLLLAMVKGKPSFCSAYLEEFPCNLEDPASTNWFAGISLAADVVSSVSDGFSFGLVDKPPSFDSAHVQDILKCVAPRPITRVLINKGLLHTESLVKHGTLRLVLEVLNLLDYLLKSLENSSHPSERLMNHSAALKAEILNRVRVLLPDPQVLLSLLSPLNSHFKSLEFTLKRKSETDNVSGHCESVSKRLKNSSISEDMDIIVGGVNPFSQKDLSGDEVADLGDELKSETGANVIESIMDVWGLPQGSIIHMDLKDGDTYFYSKLLETLKIYYRTMPLALEGLFDIFKLIPNNPLSLPHILLQSLLYLLNEHVSQFSKDKGSNKFQPQMYKHLNPFIMLLLYSPVREIKEQAYVLAKAAMQSSGAFDNNSRDICAWFFFIPGYSGTHVCATDLKVEIFEKLRSPVVSFLCDAVATTGNNLYKYLELLRHYIHDAQGGKDQSPEVSPFIICILEKCLRLLSSESGSFSFPQKSLISLYVCNTIKYLLDTQVNAGQLSCLIDRVLSEKLGKFSSSVNFLEVDGCPCEWRPLRTLLRFARDFLHRQCYIIYSNVEEVKQSDNLFINTLVDIKTVLRNEYDAGLVGLAVGFSFSLLCTSHSELLQNLSSILSISNKLLEAPLSVLASIFFLESSYLTDISELWPKLLFAGMEIVKVKETNAEMFDKLDLDSTEAASVAFGNYLIIAPFCVLFSSIIQSRSLHLFEQSALQKLLLDKLSEMPYDHLVSSLCNVLFWINRSHSSYRAGYLDNLELLSEICFMLAKHLLKQLLVDNVDTVGLPEVLTAAVPVKCAVDVAEIILNHPAVTESLESPLSGATEFSEMIFKETLETVLKLVEQGLYKMDLYVLKLVRTVSELLFPIFRGQSSEEAINGRKRVSRTFRALVQKLIVVFKNKFDASVQPIDFKSLVPAFYALHSLIHFTSPFELLELVNWLFTQVDFCNASFHLQSKETALYVCLHLAGCTFDFLSEYLWQPNSELYWFLDGGDERQFDISLFEKSYFHVSEIARRFKLDIADICLLKAVKAAKSLKVIQCPCLPSIAVLARVVASTPVNMLSHCLNGINRTKADLLYLIAEMSPLHLSVFGYMFSEALNKSFHNVNLSQDTCSRTFSDEEFVMLLPTLVLYLNKVISRSAGEKCDPLKNIISVYARVLLGGFSNWKIFVAEDIFKMRLDDTVLTSSGELSNLFSESLLGRAILMVRNHLSGSKDLLKSKRRLNIFNSVCPYSNDDDNFMDDDYVESGLYSLEQSLDFVNRIVAKINLIWMLLFEDNKQFKCPLVDNGKLKLIPCEINSDVAKSTVRFLRMLINSWAVIVKKFPSNIGYSGNIEDQNHSLFKFLETFMMSKILDIIKEMHDCLIKLSSLPFLEQLVKSVFLYRFGDSATLKLLRTVLNTLSPAKFSCASVIQLLLAHSQFAKSVHLASKSLGCTQFGMVFTPMQSILRSLITPHVDLNTLVCRSNSLTSQTQLNLLELVKLVRVLFHIYAQQRDVHRGEDIDINSKELVSLLLSSYGATCTEVDMEIYDLILDIESIDKSAAGTVAQMDYVWGSASRKVMKDREWDNDMQSVNPENMVFEERRKILFRENLPVDPKMCAQTVLYFPYSRFVNRGILDKFQKDDSIVVHEASPPTYDNPNVYDPVFILRFSIHCLSMSYTEPVEFASLGLLAISFVSISSPDEDIRKLGYEALAKFKSALEKCQKKKVVRRFLLLLSYLQNGIEEPWQRIPSIISAFLAEASMVLLDQSHGNYLTISKHLMNSPSINLKSIPLFQHFFWSSSLSFRADRSWILRLLYTGLNTEEDAQIYIRNSIFEILINFYSSPLSDNDSKELIIQIVKKAVRLNKSVWFLVDHCGVILWLSSILSSLWESESQDGKRSSFTLLPMILEVVDCITSTDDLVEWLQKHSMEQLSELASHLYKLLVSCVELVKEQSSVCNSILQILTLVLKMSEKRKMVGTYFSLSDEGLFQLCEVIEVCSRRGSNATMILGLKAVLMRCPPVTILHMDEEKLLKFLRWAVTAAIQYESIETSQSEDSDCNLIAGSEKRPGDSLISKLLSWLTAAVILGKRSCKLSKLKSRSFVERPNLSSLQSLLECHEEELGETVGYGREDILALSIFYLLQLLGFSHRVLPSAASALCLLLHSGSSELLVGLGSSLQSLCSKIHCAEANPAWRWSFDQPCGELSSELNDVEKLEELHASEKLLVLASNILVKKCHGSQFISFKDAADLHVYDWERRMFLSN